MLRLSCSLFKLDGRRRFRRDVVEDTVDAGDLVDDTGGDLLQHFIGDSDPFRSHEVRRLYAAQCHGIVIASAVTHNTHGPHIGQCREILAHNGLQPGVVHFLPEDEVRLTEDVQFVLGDLPDAADGEARPREGLTGDQILRQMQFPAQLTHF